MLDGLHRDEFPFFQGQDKPTIYLDNAATTQKPAAVISAMTDFYKNRCSSVHRALYPLAEKTTAIYEGVRKQVANFINASADEIIFTSGATAALNLVADSWGAANVAAGDEIVVTMMEHHSNLLPWVKLAEKRDATLKQIPLAADGTLDLLELDNLVTEKCKLIAVSHLSNVTGVVNPIKDIIRIAHSKGAVVVVDAAQSAPHMGLDVHAFDCDFLVFSAHKLYGPTGTGVLYGKKNLLDAMGPAIFGGGMVLSADPADLRWRAVPHRFEAGTPNIAGVIGMGAALQYLKQIGMQTIKNYESSLLAYTVKRLTEIKGLTFIGTPTERCGVVAFQLADIHPHDAASYLGEQGIAIRGGQHCAQLYHQFFGVSASLRISLSFYNSQYDIDTLITGLYNTVRFFNGTK